MKFLRHLPNILTVSRLFFTAGFLYLVAFTDHQGPACAARLNWAFVLFLIAGLTDIVDGYLARRLNVTGQFGRTFDPLVDKVLVIGGFTVFALIGPQLTAVHWWMLAVIVAREAFVTFVRHLSENQGQAFGATWAGKLKMFLQSFAIGTITMYIAHFQDTAWALHLRNLSVYLAVIFTAFSAIIYLPRIKHLRWRSAPRNP